MLIQQRTSTWNSKHYEQEFSIRLHNMPKTNAISSKTTKPILALEIAFLKEFS